jgi:hypothetical protein
MSYEDVTNSASATCPTQLDAFASQAYTTTETEDLDCFELENERPWGTLVSLAEDQPNKDLMYIPEGLQERVFNMHILGRSERHCNVVLPRELKRVSNVHCKIYCMESVNDRNKVQAWVEDHSNNGTYVNQDTRLSKGVPRKLWDRDEISLIAPVCPNKNQDPAVYAEERMKATFIFRMLHPRAERGDLHDGTVVGAPGSTRLSLATASAGGGEGKGLFWNLENMENVNTIPSSSSSSSGRSSGVIGDGSRGGGVWKISGKRGISQVDGAGGRNDE